MRYHAGVTVGGLETDDRDQETQGDRVLNFNSVLIGSGQPETLASFYARVFDKPADFNNEGYSGWQVGAGFWVVGPHSEMKGAAKEPARLLPNFETAEVKEEFARIKSAGATVVKEPYQMDGSPGWIATLADPDGNYFQLMTPMGPA
jgi:predicted enzyme related to lactoylglutathione lyase